MKILNQEEYSYFLYMLWACKSKCISITQSNKTKNTIISLNMQNTKQNIVLDNPLFLISQPIKELLTNMVHREKLHLPT